MHLNTRSGQGTIEYLVILAIIVVLALIVIGLVVSQTDSSSNVSQSSGKLNQLVGTGGISIAEAAADPAGDGLIRVSNNSGENLTLTTITPVDGAGTEATPITYNTSIVSGNSMTFSLSNISNSCSCGASDSIKICFFKLTTLSAAGLERTFTTTVMTQCTQNVTPVNPTIIVSPVSGTVNCWSEVTAPHPICTLSDLNKMREHLDWNYILSNDINAYDTISWEDGAGFLPVGDSSTEYSGMFDGGGHLIKNLFIYRPSTSQVGLFGKTTSDSVITKVGIVDANILGFAEVGGVAGKIDGNITKSFASGYFATSEADSANCVGALNGSSVGNIVDSYSNGTVYSGWGYAGGLSCGNGHIINSYSTANTSKSYVSHNSAGGLISEINTAHVINSFSTGRADSGGLIGRIWSCVGSCITNSYWYDQAGDGATQCYTNGDTNCTKITDANGGIAWFYLETNSPMNTWDFVDTWTVRDNNYPILKWQNQ